MFGRIQTQPICPSIVVTSLEVEAGSRSTVKLVLAKHGRHCELTGGNNRLLAILKHRMW